MNQDNINKIINLYTSKEISSTHKLAEMFKVGHKKISKILKENNIPINSKGGQQRWFKTTAQKPLEGNYRAICKQTGKEFNDYQNLSGALTNHLKELYPDIKIPSAHIRRQLLKHEGRYWHEEYFNFQIAEKTKTRKCKYCEWETKDVFNKSGAYRIHLSKHHKITLKNHINAYPEDKTYFKYIEFTKNNSLICQICNEQFKGITNTHLKEHGITLNDYIAKYGNNYSKETLNALSESTKESNRIMIEKYKNLGEKLPIHETEVYQTKLENNFKDYVDNISEEFEVLSDSNSYKNFQITFKCKTCKNIFTSNYRYPRCYKCNPIIHSKEENEIYEFLSSLNLNIIRNNRSLINGELDFFLPDYNIAIEFNGLYWHSELNGKNSDYHLNKTNECSENNIKLYSIFWDEWRYKQDIVKEKLRYLFHKTISVHGRNTVVKEITKQEAKSFIDTTHIQGYIASKIRLGLTHNDELIAVMTFGSIRTSLGGTANENEYELLRYSTKCHISGGASKLLAYFIKQYSPRKIISYADRRWTPTRNNMYEKIGFAFVHATKPNYWYTNDYDKRLFRYNFRKDRLVKMFSESINKTEWQIMQEQGYDRIWDCGSFKYEYIPKTY